MEIHSLIALIEDGGKGEYLPDEDCRSHMDRQWLLDVARTVLPEAFKKMLKKANDKSDSLRADRKNEIVTVSKDFLKVCRDSKRIGK